MRIAIIGGKLQGVEVAYLAKKAGYETVLIDRRRNAQAAGIVDKVVVLDVLKETEKFAQVSEYVDMFIPAVEDKAVLDQIIRIGKERKIPVIFDKEAYEISSSKEHSNQLFRELGLTMPAGYPACGFPVIVKPNRLSGSVGVRKAQNQMELESICAASVEKPVIQEFIEGRSFSLEVIGDGEHFYFPLITEVVIDDQYDCKRIIAPAKSEEKEKQQLYDMAQKLANRLQMNGIFDIEVISQNGILYIIEIDARVPSQTPISVYHATGINMIQWLVELKQGKK